MGFFTKVAKLLSGSTSSKNSYPSEDYKGLTITPQPIADHGQFRIAALIEKKGDGDHELKSHHFIRSDTVASANLAAELALEKCKIFIDQMGGDIFN